MHEGSILVTGAAGLLGRRVREMLADAGRPVLGTDIRPSADIEQLECVDITDREALSALVVTHGIGAIIHCGAVSGPMLMSDDPHKVIEINVLGTANLLEIARVHGMRRLVFCSSTSAYGPTEPPALGTGIKEEAPLRPSRVYGASKAAAEQILAGYRAQCSLDAVSIRLSWVFGPHRATPCIIRTMLENARNGDATRVDWGRDFPRQYIFVDDAAAALIAALSAPKIAAPAYTATGGTWLTIGQVADVVRAIVPKADITLADGPDPFDDYQHRFDVSAIQRDLGFRPAYGLEAGIRAYKKWLDSQPFGHRQGASP